MNEPILPPLPVPNIFARYSSDICHDAYSRSLIESWYAAALAALAQQAEKPSSCPAGCHGNDTDSYCELTRGPYCGRTNPELVQQQAEQKPVARSSDFESAAAQALQAAWREGWDNCRDAEFIGEEAEDDAFNSSVTLAHCIRSDQAPQPTSTEAQDAARMREVLKDSRAMLVELYDIFSRLGLGDHAGYAGSIEKLLKRIDAAMKPITEFAQERESWDAQNAARWRHFVSHIGGKIYTSFDSRWFNNAEDLTAAIDAAMKGGA